LLGDDANDRHDRSLKSAWTGEFKILTIIQYIHKYSAQLFDVRFFYYG